MYVIYSSLGNRIEAGTNYAEAKAEMIALSETVGQGIMFMLVLE